MTPDVDPAAAGARFGWAWQGSAMTNLQAGVYTQTGYISITRPQYMSRPSKGAPPMDRENKPKLLNRLSRIEGQVRGIARMVEEGRYCIDVLTQLQAVRAAVAKVETEMLKDHLGHCIES